MSFGEHFYGRNEVKEEGKATEMHTPSAPAVHRIEDGREDGDTCCRVENGRDSEPEKMHAVHNLKALGISIL